MENPYIGWYLLYDDVRPVGNLYVQIDNSVGLNLIEIRKDWIESILNYLNNELSPQPAIPSKSPEYFFLNVAYGDTELQRLLTELGANPIQISHKVGCKKASVDV